MGKAQDALDSGELDNVGDDVGGGVATLEQPQAPSEPFQPLGQGAEHSAFPQLDAQPEPFDAGGGAPAPTAAEVAAGASLRDRLVNELGLQGLAEAPDDWSAVSQLYEYAQLQTQQQAQLAQQYQQLQQQLAWQQHAQQQAAQQQAQLAQQAPHTPAQPEHPAWPKPPEWDPAWEQLLTTDAEGNIVARPGARPDLPQLYQQHRAHVAGVMRELSHDPLSFLQKTGFDRAIETRLQERIAKAEAEMEQKLQQRLAAHQEQQFGQQFAQQHGRWMFQQAPNGQTVFNPVTGQPAFSAEGQQVVQLAQQLAANGLSNPQLAMQLAYRMVSGAGSVAEQAANELNQALSQYTGGAAPGVNGHSAAPSPAQRQQLSNSQFLQRAQQATRQPAMNGAAPSTQQPNRGKYEGMTREQRFSAMLRDQAVAAGFLNPEDN